MPPPVHERRAPSLGSIVEPRLDPSTWEPGTELTMLRGSIGEQLLAEPVASPTARRAGLHLWARPPVAAVR